MESDLVCVLARSLPVYNGLTTLLPVLIKEVRLPRSTTDQFRLKTAARHNERRRRTLICYLYTTETTSMGCGMSTIDYQEDEEDVSVFCAKVPVTSAVFSDAGLNHSP